MQESVQYFNIAIILYTNKAFIKYSRRDVVSTGWNSLELAIVLVVDIVACDPTKKIYDINLANTVAI